MPKIVYMRNCLYAIIFLSIFFVYLIAQKFEAAVLSVRLRQSVGEKKLKCYSAFDFQFTQRVQATTKKQKRECFFFF